MLFTLTLVALIDVDIAFVADKSFRTTAVVLPGDKVSLADGPRPTRVGSASIVQVTEKPSLAWRTLTVVVGHPVVTRPSMLTGIGRAVVHVHLAVLSFEAVDADAGVPAARVGARGAVLADVRVPGALVDVFGAVSTAEFWRTGAGVSAHAVNATAAVGAKVRAAVVDVDITVWAAEACKKRIEGC